MTRLLDHKMAVVYGAGGAIGAAVALPKSSMPRAGRGVYCELRVAISATRRCSMSRLVLAGRAFRRS